jgi:hypothetical protein
VRHTFIVICLASTLVSGVGCARSRTLSDWQGPAFAAPADCELRSYLPGDTALAPSDATRDFEASYAAAARAEFLGYDACVDLYLQAAISSGQLLLADTNDPSLASSLRVWQVYHSSVAKLLDTAQRFGRLAGARGLRVTIDDREQLLPVTSHGLVWPAESFGRMLLVGDYPLQGLTERHARPGLGVPLVIVSRPGGGVTTDRFVPAGTPFAATAVLRPLNSDGSGSTAVLELHDPVSAATVSWGGRAVPLAGDPTAPFGLRRLTAERSPLLWFLEPGQDGQRASLFFIEPYQPGKIPVVFVHGLLSDPATWVDLVNDLRAVPAIAARYQFWGFRYPTGNSFLRSAAELRAALSAAVCSCDPSQTDPALRQMVIVGHSMGGLLAKLQVAHSGNDLWNSIASIPLDAVYTTPDTRHALREALYFSPHPCVQRVVFIATPHGGSSFATRLAGRVGSMLVRLPQDRVAAHRQLICDNPGVFDRSVQKGLPTSIDMLEPANPLLQAVRCLQVSPAVRMHSIIGVGYLVVGDGEGDGVVSIRSAQHENVLSECYLKAGHTDVHHDPRTKAELIEILSVHAAESLARRPER